MHPSTYYWDHSDIEKKESVEGSKNVVNELNGNTKEVIETSDIKDKVQDK